jgi:hypothetical protein
MQLVVNQPLTEEIAIRFAGEWFDQPDGSFYNAFDKRYVDRSKGYAVRGQIRYKHEKLDATLLYENAFYYLPPIHITLNIAPGTAGFPAAGFIQDPYKVHTNTSFPFQQGFENVLAKVRYDLDFATFSSVSSYRSRKSHNYNDSDLWDPISLAAAKLRGSTSKLRASKSFAPSFRASANAPPTCFFNFPGVSFKMMLRLRVTRYFSIIPCVVQNVAWFAVT